MQHGIILKKLNVDLMTPRIKGGGGLSGEIFATMLRHFVIAFNLICNMFEKFEF